MSAFEEDRDDTGNPRPGYTDLLGRLAEVDLGSLCTAVTAQLKRSGVGFGDRPFVIDPVPRLIPSAEWDELAEALAQRARALNYFMLDVYTKRRIARSGFISDELIEEAEGFEADLSGCIPQYPSPAAVIGFDVVRDSAGEFLVLEDNMRTPSGFCYALAARAALSKTLPAVALHPRPIDPLTYQLLGHAIRAASPPGVGDASIVVLTDGPGNAAYYEHAQAAARLRVPLVTPSDLERDGDRLLVRLADRTTRPVDVVYRRTNEDRVRDEGGELTEVARLLLTPWLKGNLGLVNAFGAGVADDKLVHAHVEDFIRFYLEQEPLVRSVPTRSLDTPSERVQTLARLGDRVVKPRHGHGGHGVVVGTHASREELERLRQEIERNPERYISQPVVQLSRHPTVIDGKLEPRHVDLRAFAFCAERVTLIPGGLTRVALERDALVVNSSQSGGGKDTWVVG